MKEFLEETKYVSLDRTESLAQTECYKLGDWKITRQGISLQKIAEKLQAVEEKFSAKSDWEGYSKINPKPTVVRKQTASFTFDFCSDYVFAVNPCNTAPVRTVLHELFHISYLDCENPLYNWDTPYFEIRAEMSTYYALHALNLAGKRKAKAYILWWENVRLKSGGSKVDVKQIKKDVDKFLKLGV